MCGICLFLIDSNCPPERMLIYTFSTSNPKFSPCPLSVSFRFLEAITDLEGKSYLWVKCVFMTGTKAEFFFPLLLISVEVHRFFLQVCKTKIFMYQGYQLFVMLLQFFVISLSFVILCVWQNNFYGWKCHFSLYDLYSCNDYSPIF